MNTRSIVETTGYTAPVPARDERMTPERWELDERQSRITFKLVHLFLHQIGGRFDRCGGTLFIDREHPTLSSVSVWVDLASVSTDAPERDAHARSAEFLDVARFPMATFDSTTVEIRDGVMVIAGRLSLHGVVRDIEVTVRPVTMPPAADAGQRGAFTARTTINRQAFGLHWNQDLDVGGIVLGDEIDVEARMEVVRAADT